MPEGLSFEQIDEGFWRITDPGYARPSHCYLIAGQERAALIDTGLGMWNIRETVQRLTDLDIVVLQTHAHPDHAGGSYLFEDVRAHPRAVDKLKAGWRNAELRFDLERYFQERSIPGDAGAETFEIPGCKQVEALANRDFVDLGGRQLDVFFTPGHSRDSVSFFDLERGRLFTGDSVLKGQIAIEDSAAYRRSILDLVKLADLSNGVFPGHGESPIDPAFVGRVRQGFTDAITDRHPSGFLAGFATFQFDEFGIMLPPRRRRLQDE